MLLTITEDTLFYYAVFIDLQSEKYGGITCVLRRNVVSYVSFP